MQRASLVLVVWSHFWSYHGNYVLVIFYIYIYLYFNSLGFIKKFTKFFTVSCEMLYLIVVLQYLILY